jgi:hypothetical protein
MNVPPECSAETRANRTSFKGTKRRRHASAFVACNNLVCSGHYLCDEFVERGFHAHVSFPFLVQNSANQKLTTRVSCIESSAFR